MSTEETQKNDHPPARDGEIAEIPELEVGDKIVVETTYNSDTNRTLTVEEHAGDDGVEVDALEYTVDAPQTVLSGYGTTYYLVTTQSMSGGFQRVNLVWNSRPEGIPVGNIEVRA